MYFLVHGNCSYFHDSDPDASGMVRLAVVEAASKFAIALSRFEFNKSLRTYLQDLLIVLIRC